MDKTVILSETTNCPVIKMQGRKFPGILIQGDTLRTLLFTAEKILADNLDEEDRREEAEDLRDTLKNFVIEYERVLDTGGVSLPYPNRVTRK